MDAAGIKDKRKVLLWTFTYGQLSVSRPAKTYIHQLFSNTSNHLDDLLKAMTDKDRQTAREREREREGGGRIGTVSEICTVGTF